jgi:hypothetical protein
MYEYVFEVRVVDLCGLRGSSVLKHYWVHILCR